MRSTNTRSLCPLAVAFVLALGGVACGGGEFEADFPVEVRAIADGVGVEGVALEIDGKRLGETDEDGLFEGSHHGVEGTEVVIAVTPPDDFELRDEADASIKATLKAKHPRDGEPEAKPVAFTIDIKPTSLDYVVIVSAPGKFRPIYVDGEIRGRTNSRGVEVIHFRAKPGREVEVRVDTTSKKLSPLLKKFEVSETDRVLSVDEDDEVKEDEDDKAARVAAAKAREEAAIARRVERAKRRGGRAAAKAATIARAVPRESDVADEEDVEVVQQVRRKAALRAAAQPPEPEAEVEPQAALEPVAAPFDKKKARAIKKDLSKITKGIGKAKRSAGKIKGKLKKLARKPGAGSVVEAQTPAYEAAMAKIDGALTAAKAASKALKAATKAKDMAEILEQERAGRLAETDALEGKEEAEAAYAQAAEEIDRALAELAAKEEEVRAETASLAEAGVTASKEASKELKALAKDAKTKARKAKKGKKEARGFAKQVAKQSKALAKPTRALAKLSKKVKRAKGPKLLDLKSKIEAETAKVGEILAAGKTAMVSLEEAIADKPVAVAPKTEPKPVVKKKKKKRRGTKIVDRKPKSGKCPPDLECEFETLTDQIDEGEVDRCLVKKCERVSVSTPNGPDIHLTLAKYWGRKKKRRRQLRALDRATSFGQYKYDPNVLYGYLKVAVAARKFSKAIEMKDRFMQVKDRLPGGERKTKVCEILSVLAQAYEHDYYRQQEKHEDQDFTPLLGKAVRFWEEYAGYCGDKAKAAQRIEQLKKIREESGL